jgi:hypothetical protein
MGEEENVRMGLRDTKGLRDKRDWLLCKKRTKYGDD